MFSEAVVIKEELFEKLRLVLEINQKERLPIKITHLLAFCSNVAEYQDYS